MSVRPAQEQAPQRRRLVKLLRDRGIRDPRVLEAIGEVPRHLFVPPQWVKQAYSDFALPIAAGQTISQPWVVARMTELLEVGAEHKVLEIGTGSGYQTAVLARLGRWVFSLERIPELAREAIRRMRDIGVENVKIQAFDGTVGWSEMGPFHRILVTAGAPRVPEPLLDQLAEGGRLLLPEGGRVQQRLVLYTREHEQHFTRAEAEDVAFVPLVGRFGWPTEGSV